jgi:hypothetical protein
MVNKEAAADSALQLKSVQIKVAVSNWEQPTLMECGGSTWLCVSLPPLRATTARPGLEGKAATSGRTPEFPPIYDLCPGFI